jgi:integrase
MAPLFRANKLLLVPARPAALSQYIDKIATDLVPMKATTIRRRMASVSMLHRAAGIESPTRSQLVRDALTRHRRAKGTRTNQAAPLRTEDIRQMLTWIGNAPADLRDRALILVAHDTALRASELLSLKVEQIQRTDRGRGLVFLERSKTDGEGQGVFIAISKAALAAIEGWVVSVGITVGPLFRGFDLNGNLREGPLSRQSYDRIIKFRASAIGLGAGISAHSSRVGFAQDLLAKGASHLAVMQAGRWKSIGMVLHYGERIEAEKSVATERFLDEI